MSNYEHDHIQPNDVKITDIDVIVICWTTSSVMKLFWTKFDRYHFLCWTQFTITWEMSIYDIFGHRGRNLQILQYKFPGSDSHWYYNYTITVTHIPDQFVGHEYMKKETLNLMSLILINKKSIQFTSEFYLNMSNTNVRGKSWKVFFNFSLINNYES